MQTKTVEINDAEYSCCELKDAHIDGLVTAIYSFMSQVELLKKYSDQWQDVSRLIANIQYSIK